MHLGMGFERFPYGTLGASRLCPLDELTCLQKVQDSFSVNARKHDRRNSKANQGKLREQWKSVPMEAFGCLGVFERRQLACTTGEKKDPALIARSMLEISLG